MPHEHSWFGGSVDHRLRSAAIIACATLPVVAAFADGGLSGPWASALSIVGAAIGVLWAAEAAHRRRLVLPDPMIVAVLGLVAVWIGLSSFWSIDQGAHRIAATRSLAMIWLLLAATALMARRRRLGRFTSLLLAGAGVYLLLAASTRGLQVAGLLEGGIWRGRLSFTFGNPNHLAAWALCIGFVALGAAIEWRGLGRAYALVVALCAMVVTFDSGSRGALLGLLCGLLFLATIALFKGGTARRMLVLALLVPILAAPLVWTRAADRAGTVLDPFRGGQRLELWSCALSTLADRPLLGGGLACFELASQPHQSTELAQRTVNHAHNELLELAVELGVPVALLVGLAACWVLLLGLREPPLDPIRLAWFAALSGLLGHSLVEYLWRTPATALLGILALAVVLPPRRSRMALEAGGARALMIAAIVSFLAIALGAGRYEMARGLLDEADLLRRDDPTRSVDLAWRAHRLQPAWSRPWTSTALSEERLALDTAHDAKQAQTHLERGKHAWLVALSRRNDDPGALSGLGRIESALGDHSSAVTHFEEAIDAAPGRGAPRLELGLAQLDQGRPELARRTLGSQVGVDAEVVRSLALDLIERGHDHRQTGTMIPDTAIAHSSYARLLIERRDPELAIEHAEHAWELAPDASRARAHLRILQASGYVEEASEAALSYLKAHPGDDLLARRAVISLARAGEHAAVLEATAEILARRPRDYEFLAFRANAIEATSGTEAALEAIDSAVALLPGEWRGWRHRGELLLRLSREIEALEAFESAERIAPQRSELAAAVARTALAIGDTLRARDAAERCLALAAENRGCRRIWRESQALTR